MTEFASVDRAVTTPAPPVSAPTPPPRPPSPSPLPLILSIIAVTATALLWVRVERGFDDLRARDAALATEVARLGKSALVDLEDAPTLGPASARVFLIEFSDYECPFCIRHTRETMPKIDANYIQTGKIRYAFRDFPIDQLHPEAIRAHEAGRCAAEQGRFWEIHKRLFSAPGTHSVDALEALASEVGLNVPAFRSCLTSGRTAPAIRETAQIAVDLGANGTPAFFIGVHDPTTDQVRIINGVSGAQPYEVFTRTLDAVLKEHQ